MESRREILKLALEMSEKAGNFLRRHFYSKKIFSRKKGGEGLLTPSDRESEEIIRGILEKKDPRSGICGEEYGLTRPKAQNWWCLDPLDGTTNFVRGIPFFSVSIAYCEKGIPVVGVVYEPIQKLLYYAIRGGGAFYQRHPLKSQRSPLYSSGGAMPITLFSMNLGYGTKLPGWFKKWGEHSKLRNLGSMALQLCYVADSVLDFCVSDRAHLWDIAAGALILEESGGRLVGFDKKPLFPLREPWPKIAARRFPFVAVGHSHISKIK